MIQDIFFNRDAVEVAKDLIGKVIRVRHQSLWLCAMIIETEAYYREEKGSHASLGLTPKRKALFMPPGTIYMYYARGGDSLNMSCQGEGNAVLIKSASVYVDAISPAENIQSMQKMNPIKQTQRLRPINRCCSGQTLLCQSLGLRVPDWDQKNFCSARFFIEDVGYIPIKMIQTARLGIPKGRDEHLMYRFVDYDYARIATSNPLTKRGWKSGREYLILNE